jgi:hypothetical protein
LPVRHAGLPSDFASKPIKENTMGEYKGRGVKGRGYDELSGVGTSSAGITGTTGNLNTGGRDGGIGEPPHGDAGNRQTADRGQSDGTPALGNAGRAGQHSRQGGQGSGSRSGSPGAGQDLEDQQAADKPDPSTGSQSR